MATLQGKKIVVIGGSSGIGYGVVKASLLSLAAHVIVASSSAQKVAKAVSRLVAEPALQAIPGLASKVTGDAVDLGDTQSIRAFFEKIGEFDHLVITGGTLPEATRLRGANLNNMRGAFSSRLEENAFSDQFDSDAFDVRFWGAATAAQAAKIREGGSITFTVG